MTIKSDIPQICALRERIEKKIGKTLNTHSDFIELTSLIELELRQHISESTLERVWNYSTRGYDNVSLRTLNVLSNFAIGKNWNSFCDLLKKENKIESEVFNLEVISTEDLKVGDKITIGAQTRYVGGIKYDYKIVGLFMDRETLRRLEMLNQLSLTEEQKEEVISRTFHEKV